MSIADQITDLQIAAANANQACASVADLVDDLLEEEELAGHFVPIATILNIVSANMAISTANFFVAFAAAGDEEDLPNG